MHDIQQLIGDIETHSVQGIRECFEAGIDPNISFRGLPLIDELTSEYARTDRFRECVKAFVDHGLSFSDTPLLAVLLNDAERLEALIRQDAGIASRRYTLRCAYTPMDEVTLLHVCAEFNHVLCADILVKYGADCNAKAGLDEYGFGGQTPIFHTVNQNNNQSKEMLQFLLDQAADTTVLVKGLIWGRGYDWETLIPSVNAINYAMMGLLPQMHRDEVTISGIVTTLLSRAYGIDYMPGNVPCVYLKS